MKLVSLLVVTLLPVGLIAAPVADIDNSNVQDTGANIFKRKDVTCKIVGGSSEVNCRSGPGTQYSVVTTLGRYSEWVFSCVRSGQCVNIGGSVNCGWHYISYLGNNGCYVNGHYTDIWCTLDSLGRC